MMMFKKYGEMVKCKFSQEERLMLLNQQLETKKIEDIGNLIFINVQYFFLSVQSFMFRNLAEVLVKKI